MKQKNIITFNNRICFYVIVVINLIIHLLTESVVAIHSIYLKRKDET